MAISVRAKFKCVSVKTDDVGTKTYEFWAASSGEANKTWSKWTPGGNLSIQITNPNAQVFEPGKYYFLDFSSAAEAD